ncbi:winged helix-turn-helix transcriptional regulator [Amycolatopsis sp. H20-H5]|uniref:winged helix-turn-helix transcriptional regulator n=1 Tax=Amycolatopsis sp. H20-H5 TaxID=3046309 RepID=UPI002DBEF2B9|nr:helix-turn-helix domain-containing protein [Amycolatopsis sp. H20-H5]MEC3977980.1 helix-turn-helix domain-containing protein [Amycolatopsis sp. H20-H5]
MDTVDHLASETWVKDFFEGECPSRTVLGMLTNKWTLLTVAALRLHEGPARFAALRRRLAGITPKMLTQTLRALERDGLVTRTVYPTVPPRVEYALTALGVSADGLLEAVGVWSECHIGQIVDARRSYDDRPGEPVPSPG